MRRPDPGRYGSDMAFRFSTKPAKQLLYNWLNRDLARSEGMEIGLDVGCGWMQNRPFFRTRRYIGMDLDAERLEKGQKDYPGAEAVKGRIGEAGLEIQGDCVVCVQVFNNQHFDPAQTFDGVRALVAMTRTGGMLVFNIAKRAFDAEADIDSHLGNTFETVDKDPYGALSGVSLGPLSPLVAAAMDILPALRRGAGYQKIYYRCSGKR